MIIGNKKRFAFVLGRQINGNQRIVDIYVSGLLLTSFDNLVFIPQFITSIQREIETIESGKIPQEHSALYWGATTDDFSGRLTIRNFHDIQLHCKHSSGKKVTLNIKKVELIQLFKMCIQEIKNAT